MPNRGALEYCMLNVAASPHPEGIYWTIFDDAALSHVRFWGDLHATISKPIRLEDGFFRGRIAIWTEIDTSEPAIKTDVLEEVDVRDLDLSLPSNVGFNGRIFTFVFREEDHIAFVETKNDIGKNLSPSRAAKILQLLFSPEVLGVDAPMVEVTVIPDEDALKRILGLHYLRSIHMQIVRPNADDLDVQDILDGLVEQGAKSQTLHYTAASGEGGLKLNERSKTQAETAAYNGYVAGSGTDEDGNKVELSTKEYPRLIRRVVGEFGSSFESALAVAKETIFGGPRD